MQASAKALIAALKTRNDPRAWASCKSSRVRGSVIFRKRLRRHQLLSFFAGLPRCLVAMEACASAHYWARQISALGHEARLIPPAYVKPFVHRQKNDMADAQAICDAVQRPTMRFVTPKSAQAQGAAVIFRTSDLLVRQRTQLINALRGRPAEFGFIVAQGPGHVSEVVDLIDDPASDIPAEARPVLAMIAASLQTLHTNIAELDRKARSKADPVARRLMTIPGIGPNVATALVALAPAAHSFRRERLRRLVGTYPKAAFQRWQRASGQNNKDG